MAALTTVADYITGARRLLLDETSPYRYSDADLVDALNYAHLDARRIYSYPTSAQLQPTQRRVPRPRLLWMSNTGWPYCSMYVDTCSL